MYYTIYKIANKINGKIYIGSHKTKNLNDRYMGSGKYLKHSQKKHGLENFEKEILHVFDTAELMYAKEKELVNADFIAEENTYNIKIGGFGGWDHISYSKEYMRELAKKGAATRAGTEAFSEKMRNDPEYRLMFSAIQKKQENERLVRLSFKGNKHSDETKKVMSDIAKERLKDPTKNNQYGKMWIYSLEEQISKRINKDDPIPEGWLKGRKIKF